MIVQARPASYAAIETMREAYRSEAGCQIVHDSGLRRGIADPYQLLLNGDVVGYAGVFNKYYEGRITEFHVDLLHRRFAQPLFRNLIGASGATSAEAQTNMPLMLTMLFDHAKDIQVENILFADRLTTDLQSPGLFRKFTEADMPFGHSEPPGDWVVEFEGQVVAWGGILTHYNPPYGDLYMETAEAWRGRGFGSYIVQELKKVAYSQGLTPAARCNPDNAASRRTMEKAGLLPIARMLAGSIQSP